jgi:hypothetical protein
MDYQGVGGGFASAETDTSGVTVGLEMGDGLVGVGVGVTVGVGDSVVGVGVGVVAVGLGVGLGVGRAFSSKTPAASSIAVARSALRSPALSSCWTSRFSCATACRSSE